MLPVLVLESLECQVYFPSYPALLLEPFFSLCESKVSPLSVTYLPYIASFLITFTAPFLMRQWKCSLQYTV